MIVKPCNETLRLILFRYLNSRMTLSHEDAANYHKLEKGFEGEKQWSEFLNHGLINPHLMYNNLLYKVHGSELQIDNLLNLQGLLHLFEVKNMEGDYYIEGDKWYTGLGTEIKDPILQLKRSTTLFSQLLLELGFNMKLESKIIFINPEFQLYNAPHHLPIVYPNQLNRFLHTLNKKANSTKVTPTSRDYKLSEKLIESQIEENAYRDLPTYSFETNKKGINCKRCDSPIEGVSGYMTVCKTCGHKESVTSAVLRCIEEYSLLYPERKITTKDIVSWCDIVSVVTIKKILKEYYEMCNHGRSTYYLKKD